MSLLQCSLLSSSGNKEGRSLKERKKKKQETEKPQEKHGRSTEVLTVAA